MTTRGSYLPAVVVAALSGLVIPVIVIVGAVLLLAILLRDA